MMLPPIRSQLDRTTHLTPDLRFGSITGSAELPADIGKRAIAIPDDFDSDAHQDECG
jgi:hypothetical protein